MVLPPPAAHPGAAQAPGWLDRLIRPLELTREGILLCLRDATPTQLGPVVRALSPSPPWSEAGEVLEVCLRATDVLDVAPGSRVLLRVRTEDLDWLNLARPLFAERKLRTVLWADAAAHEGLVRRAVDFFDWISRTVSVPAKAVPDFAIERMRTAMDSDAEVAWEGQGLREALAAAGFSTTIDLHVEEPYLQLIASLRREGVPVVAGLRSAVDAWRMRFAMAEAGRAGSWIACDPGALVAGMQRLSAQQAKWDDASEELGIAGWNHAALMAAWVDLDPQRIEQARAHVNAAPVEPMRLDGILERDTSTHAMAMRDIEAEVSTTESLIDSLLADAELDTARTIAREWLKWTEARRHPQSRRASGYVQRLSSKLVLTPNGPLTSGASARDIPDRELLFQWVQGDRAAGSALVERHYPMLRRFMAARIPEMDSGDLVQETFKRLIESASRLSRDASVRTHLLAIARTVVKEEMHRRSEPSTIPVADSIEDPAVDPATLIEGHERLQQVSEALHRLPLDLQELVELRIIHELSYDEIAEILGIPTSSARSRFVRAKQRLTSMLGYALPNWR